MAKAIPTRLTAYTRWGNVCTNTIYPTYSAAHKQGIFLVENGFAFSYELQKTK